jgi:hypothetical protein
MPIYFQIPIPNYNALVNVGGDLQQYVTAAQNDQMILFLPNKQRIDIEYTYKDFLEKYRDFFILIQQVGGANNDRTTFLTQYATKEFLDDEQKYLEDARDGLRVGRNGQLPDGSQLQDPADPGLTDTMTAAQGAAHLLTGNDGLCLGGEHSAQNTKDFLYDILANNAMQGVGLIFVEEIKTWMQPMLDRYHQLPNPPGFPATLPQMPPKLKKALDKLSQDNSIAAPKDFTGVVEEARKRGARVVGIDSGEADPEADPEVARKNAVYGERRCAMMNFTSKKIMDEAIADAKQQNPNVKFVALMGEEHLNTAPGGVPGLSQLFKAPPVTLTAGGKLQWKPENPQNRGMPSKEEQAFIDAFLKKSDKMYYAQGGAAPLSVALQQRLRKQAAAQARTLKQPGKLKSPDQAAKLVNDNAVKGAITNFVTTATQEMGQTTWEQLVTAVREGHDVDAVDALLTTAMEEDNATLTKDVSGGDLKTLLHSACHNGHPEIAALLISQGANPNQADSDGNTALHAACERRPDAEDFLRETVEGGTKIPGERDYIIALQKRRFGAITRTLAANGANLDAKNKAGQAGLHLAAMNGLTKNIEKLLTSGANAALTDKRGWKAIDMAVASGKVETEQAFFTAQAAQNAKLVKDNEGRFSTIEILMRATRFEDTNDRNNIETMYKELYADPLMRPILDLAAVDAAGDRRPPQLATGNDRGGGLRLFVANGTKDSVGSLYNATDIGKSTPPAAGYDHEANVLLMAAGTTKNLKGEMIHELTHMAARAACNKEAIPAADQKAKTDYLKAIQETVASMHLTTDDPAEARVRELMSGRMASYAGRMGDTGLLQEFIVGIPQMIVEFGEPAVRKHAPDLFNYFKDFGDHCTKVAMTAHLFHDEQNHLDFRKNKTLANAPRPQAPPVTGSWVTPDDAMGKQQAGDLMDAVLAKVRIQYAVDNGQVGNLPPGVTVPFGPENFVISANQQRDLEKSLKKAREALKEVMFAEKVPRELSADDFRAMVKKTANLVATTHIDVLEGVLKKEATHFVRKQKVKFVDHRLATEKDLTAEEIAEAVVIKAQAAAWNVKKSLDDALDAIDVNEDKHAKMVAAVASKLTGYNPKTGNVATIQINMDNAVTKMASQPNLLRVKPQYDGKANTDHVSMDSQNQWLKQLAAF